MSKEIKEEKAISSYAELDAAVTAIHREYEPGDEPHLELTKSFFEALTRGSNEISVTYGKPGVRLYVQGKKDECDRLETMPADEFRTMEITRLAQENKSKPRGKRA